MTSLAPCRAPATHSVGIRALTDVRVSIRTSSIRALTDRVPYRHAAAREAKAAYGVPVIAYLERSTGVAYLLTAPSCAR